MARRIVAIVLIAVCCTYAIAQQKSQTPSQAVVSFYGALKQKRYVDGFRHSVYRAAVDGLTEAELKELEPEFARTFAAIPEKIEPRDEKVTGDTAVVSVKFEGIDELQQVTLIQVDGDWLVGDQESLALVRQQGRSFFFVTRMLVNEGEAFMMISRVVGAEIIYGKRYEGVYATLEELIRLGGVPKDLEDRDASGYRFSLTLAPDKRSFSVAAVPVEYGKTGRLSFYADIDGTRAEDLKGQAATKNSPVYQPGN